MCDTHNKKSKNCAIISQMVGELLSTHTEKNALAFRTNKREQASYKQKANVYTRTHTPNKRKIRCWRCIVMYSITIIQFRNNLAIDWKQIVILSFFGANYTQTDTAVVLIRASQVTIYGIRIFSLSLSHTFNL